MLSEQDDADPSSEWEQHRRDAIEKATTLAKATAREVVETWLALNELQTRHNQLVSVLLGAIEVSEGADRPAYTVALGEDAYVITHNPKGSWPAGRINITPTRIV